MVPAATPHSATRVESELGLETIYGLDNTMERGKRTTTFEAAPLIKPPALRGVSDHSLHQTGFTAGW